MPTRKSATPVPALLAACIIGTAVSCTPVGAAGKRIKDMPTLKQDFRKLDKSGDGYLSMEEFKAAGLDELAFKAADTDSDGRVDPDEYRNYTEAKREER
ncbi:MAG: EF-hand domain-containing protein [Sulfuricella sp.]|nr:EF-hand domain-containing protein [Sulfuricella sp.]